MRNTFPSFSPQPQHVSHHRFDRHYSVISVFQTSPWDCRLVIPMLPKQVSRRIDRWFTSSYSPPYLAATQLLSVSECMAYSGADFHRSDVTPSRAYKPRGEDRGDHSLNYLMFSENTVYVNTTPIQSDNCNYFVNNSLRK